MPPHTRRVSFSPRHDLFIGRALSPRQEARGRIDERLLGRRASSEQFHGLSPPPCHAAATYFEERRALGASAAALEATPASYIAEAHQDGHDTNKRLQCLWHAGIADYLRPYAGSPRRSHAFGKVVTRLRSMSLVGYGAAFGHDFVFESQRPLYVDKSRAIRYALRCFHTCSPLYYFTAMATAGHDMRAAASTEQAIFEHRPAAAPAPAHAAAARRARHGRPSRSPGHF